ncbi:MAG: hypothetical protein C0467_27925 [Planctomycetaceae bacterium]|nr:hypothetical protein [Planctomycetaceae bacterium]
MFRKDVPVIARETIAQARVVNVARTAKPRRSATMTDAHFEKSTQEFWSQREHGAEDVMITVRRKGEVVRLVRVLCSVATPVPMTDADYERMTCRYWGEREPGAEDVAIAVRRDGDVVRYVRLVCKAGTFTGMNAEPSTM